MLGRKGVRVTSRERRLIARFRLWLEKERDTPPKNRIGVHQVEKRLKAATGLSARSLRRFHRESKEKGEVDISPKKRNRYSKTRMRINPDDFDRAAIRRTVHEFYERKAYPTLTTLLASVRQKGVFEGGRTALAMLLKNIGFRHCKRNDKGLLL